MILTILLVTFIKSEIPEEFKEIASKALKNAQIKRPKEARQETLLPGEYKGLNYHYKLLKTFSDSYTNDIKGFAIDNNYVAIVKRKNFNIANDFIFVDNEEQKIYHLQNVVAEDDKVLIYKSSETSIFNVLTNFSLKETTKKPLDDLSFQPSFEYLYKWDSTINKPTLENYKDIFKYGYGAKINADVELEFQFNNIFDVKFLAFIELKILFGGEIVVEDDTSIDVPDINVLSISIPIPAFSHSISILSYKIGTNLNFNFDIDLKDMKFEIPIGFDFFKGYNFYASKYYEITPYSISSADWKYDLAKLPEEDTLADIIKSILSAKFSGVAEIVPSFSFMLILGKNEYEIKLGIKVPLTYNFNFNTQICQAPYLYGTFTIPFTGFINLPEFKMIGCTIFEEKTLEKVFYDMSIGSFCLGTITSEQLQEILPESEKIQESLKSYTNFEGLTMKGQIKFTISFNENQKMTYIQCTFSDNQVGKYLLFQSQDRYGLKFFYNKDRKSFNDNLFYFKIPSKQIILPIQRTVLDLEEDIVLKIAFFEIPNGEILSLNPSSSLTINVNPNGLTAFICPIFNGAYFLTMTPLNVNYNNIVTDQSMISYQIDDTCSLNLVKPFGYTSRYNLKLLQTSSQIQNTQPLITVKLDFLKDIIENSAFNYQCSYTIFCENANKVVARSSSTLQDITSVKGTIGSVTYFKFTLTKTNLRGNYELTFIPFCKSESDSYCYLNFPQKQSSQITEYYHLQYGNRDGISLTGSGFLAEVLPISSSNSYIYYKTFSTPLKIKKIQKPSSLDVKMEDIPSSSKKLLASEVDPVISNPKRICVYADGTDQIIPFSRKYVTNNMETFFKNNLNFNIQDDDYSQITNDEDGCIVFNSKLLTGDFSYNLPAEATDFKIEFPLTPKTNNYIFCSDFSKIPEEYSLGFTYGYDENKIMHQVNGVLNLSENYLFNITFYLLKSPKCSETVELITYLATTSYKCLVATLDFIPEECKDPQAPIVDPTEIPIPSIFETHETLTINVDDAKNDQKLDRLFSNAYKNSGNNEILTINTESKTIEFNSYLPEKQFIKVKDKTQINYNGGNLNLALNNNAKEYVDILLKNNNANTNIKLYGNGNVNLKLPNESEERTSINIRSKSQINGSVSIKVPSNVKDMSIESIDIVSDCILTVKDELDNDLNVNVEEIDVTANTNSYLKKIKIENALKIPQSAVLTFDDIEFGDNTIIEYQIYNYGKWNNPILNGNLKQPPSKIKLLRPDGNEKPELNEEYILLKGSFDINECNKWGSALDYLQSGFNEFICSNSANTKSLQEETVEMNIKYTDSGSSEGSKLPLIIGVVVGVVVVVAIVIVVVVIVIKKRKNSNKSSEGENDENKAEGI